MKTVNLLPAWYLQQSRRNRRLRTHILVMIMLATGVTAATIMGRQYESGLEAQRVKLEHQLERTSNPDTELARTQTELQRLEDLRLARRELGNTVPMSAVIQQFQNEMTQGMALSNIGIDVRSEPVKGSGFVGDIHNPPRNRDVAHLCIVGIAPNDFQITQFIDKVSKNPLFADVTLDFTRSSLLQEYPVRKFQIQLSMDLERLTTQALDVAGTQPGAAPIASGESAHGE